MSPSQVSGTPRVSFMQLRRRELERVDTSGNSQPNILRHIQGILQRIQYIINRSSSSSFHSHLQVAHATFDRFNGFLGLPVEFEPEVPSASTGVFGVSTESMQLSFDS